MMSERVYKAQQMRRALELYVQTITDESVMLEVADVFPPWEDALAKLSKMNVGDTIRYGLNADGEAQLYQVIQAHDVQADWTPDTAVSLYKKVGITAAGIPIWTQPLGSNDAYMKGDEVSYNSVVYISQIDNNVWSPDAYPAGWKAK